MSDRHTFGGNAFGGDTFAGDKLGGLRLYLGRRLLTSAGGRANAAQGLLDVRRDQSDRAEGEAAFARAERGYAVVPEQAPGLRRT